VFDYIPAPIRVLCFAWIGTAEELHLNETEKNKIVNLTRDYTRFCCRYRQRAGRSGVRIPFGARDFSLLKVFGQAVGHIQTVFDGYRNSFPGVKRQVCIVDHSCLVPKLGISGAKPLLLLRAFKE